jgi:hypothetical protein
MLSGMVVGIFVQHAAGVIGGDGDDLAALIMQRARETAQILRDVS